MTVAFISLLVAELGALFASEVVAGVSLVVAVLSAAAADLLLPA